MSGTGRRRANVRQYSAEDQALTAISKEAENRLAAKRAARAEAREIRMKEIEKREREAEENLNNEHHVNKSRPERTGSRRGSDESSEGAGDGPLGGERELKKELRALEEKYKAAMMSSAQLDNEKQSLVYQVELLKDQLEEQAESQTELQREYKEKSRNLELTKRELQAAQLELKALREQNDYKDRLIAESGLVIVAAENGEMSLEQNPDGPSSNGHVGTGAVLLSSEALDMLNKSAEGSLGTASLAPSHTPHTTYPAPSASTNLASQPGREEHGNNSGDSSGLAGRDFTASGAEAAHTPLPDIGSDLSHCPGDTAVQESQSAKPETQNNCAQNEHFGLEEIEPHKETDHIDGKESSVDREWKGSSVDGPDRVAADIGNDSVDWVGPKFENENTDQEVEPQGNETQRVESEAVSSCTTLHGDEGNLDDARQNVSAEHESHKEKITDQIDLIKAKVATDTESAESNAAIVGAACSADVPSIIITECSHSQQAGSQGRESEDEVDVFFDAVSTPLPSPQDGSSHFELQGSHIGESCTDTGLSEVHVSSSTEFGKGEQGGAADGDNEFCQSEGLESTPIQEVGFVLDKATAKEINMGHVQPSQEEALCSGADNTECANIAEGGGKHDSLTANQTDSDDGGGNVNSDGDSLSQSPEGHEMVGQPSQEEVSSSDTDNTKYANRREGGGMNESLKANQTESDDGGGNVNKVGDGEEDVKDSSSLSPEGCETVGQSETALEGAGTGGGESKLDVIEVLLPEYLEEGDSMSAQKDECERESESVHTDNILTESSSVEGGSNAVFTPVESSEHESSETVGESVKVDVENIEELGGGEAAGSAELGMPPEDACDEKINAKIADNSSNFLNSDKENVDIEHGNDDSVKDITSERNLHAAAQDKSDMTEELKPAREEESVEDTDTENSEEPSDFLSPLGQRKTLNHDLSDGVVSEDSEARLDDEYNFDDIGEVLDDGRKSEDDKKDTDNNATMEETDSHSEDAASVLSKDSGMQEVLKSWNESEVSVDTTPSKGDDNSTNLREPDVHVDSASIASVDRGTGKEIHRELGAEGGFPRDKSASMDSLDLEAKLDKLVATSDSPSKDQSKQKQGSHKKSKKFKIFKNIFHK